MVEISAGHGETVPGSPAPPQAATPHERIGGLRAVLFILAWGGAFLAIITPVSSTLAVRLSQLSADQAEAAQALGWIMGVGSLISIVVTPLMGYLSDNTTVRWGRRRPWLVIGSVLTLAALVALGLAPTIALAAVAWWAIQLCSSAVTMVLAAFMPDWVPEDQRGRIGGWVGIAQQCVPLAGIYVAQIVVSQNLPSVLLFLVPGVAGFLFVFVFAFVMPDKVVNRADVSRVSPLALLKSFTFSPRRYPDFAWAWLGRFLMALMFQIYAIYQLYFIVARFAPDLGDALTLQLLIGVVSVLVIIVSAHISGWYSDRTRRRKNGVYLGSGLFVVAMVMHAFAYDLAMLWAASIVASVAIGVYFAIDLALVTDVLPEKETRAANGMGIFNMANALPGSFAPFAAPFLLAIGGTGENYVALWLAAAVVAVLGSLTVARIRSVR